jgi:hypothetical protein
LQEKKRSISLESAVKASFPLIYKYRLKPFPK